MTKTQLDDADLKMDSNGKFKGKIPRALKIDKGLLAVKFSFFCTYACLGSYMPYLIVFLISIGLSATQAGFIIGLKTIVSLIAGLSWGVLVDKSGKLKLIHVTVFLTYIFVIFSLPWVAAWVCDPVDDGADIPSTFNNSMNSTYNSWNGTNVTSTTSWNGTNVTSTTSIPVTMTTMAPVKKRGNAIDTMQVTNKMEIFYVMVAILSVVAVFESPLQAFLDSMTIYILKHHRKKANYGMQRAFGGLGLATGNLFAGFVADIYSVPNMSAYTGIFYVFLAVGIGFMVIIVFIYRGRDMSIREGDLDQKEMLDMEELENENGVSKKKKRQPVKLFKPLLKVFSQFSNVMFFTTVGIIGFAHSINYAILYLYMADDFDASKSLMGLATFIACTSELVIFPIAAKIIKLFKGPWFCVIIGLFSYSARYFLYSFAQNVWIIICLQCLHMFGFGLFWSAAVEHTRKLSTEDTVTTMFMILNVAHTPLGNLIGNMIGGLLYDMYGGRTFFMGIATFLGAWAFLMLIYNILCLRNESYVEEIVMDDCEEELKQLTNLEESKLDV